MDVKTVYQKLKEGLDQNIVQLAADMQTPGGNELGMRNFLHHYINQQDDLSAETEFYFNSHSREHADLRITSGADYSALVELKSLGINAIPSVDALLKKLREDYVKLQNIHCDKILLGVTLANIDLASFTFDPHGLNLPTSYTWEAFSIYSYNDDLHIIAIGAVHEEFPSIDTFL